MNALVIYDSNFGNTKTVAEEIVSNLDGNAKTVSVKNFHTSDLAGVDLVVWGSPINGWRPTDATMSALNSLSQADVHGIKFATFDTRIKSFMHGDAKNKMAEKMRTLGGTPVVEPRAFYVRGKGGPLFDGEINNARHWAQQIMAKLT